MALPLRQSVPSNKEVDVEVVEDSDSRPHKPVVFDEMLGK